MGLGHSAANITRNERSTDRQSTRSPEDFDSVSNGCVESVLDLDSDPSYSIISKQNADPEIPNRHQVAVQTNCYKDYHFCASNQNLNDIIADDDASFAPSLNNSNRIPVSINKHLRNQLVSSMATASNAEASSSSSTNCNSGSNCSIADFRLPAAAAEAAALASAAACRSSSQQRARYLTDRQLQQNHHHQRLETPRRRRRRMVTLGGCGYPGLLAEHRRLLPDVKLTPWVDERTENNSSNSGSFGLLGVNRNAAIDLPGVFKLGICNNKIMMRSDNEIQQQPHQQESSIHPGVSHKSRSPSLGTSVSNAASTIVPTTICPQKKQQHPSNDSSTIDGFGDGNSAVLRRFLADQMRRLAEESRRQFLATATKSD